MQAYKDIIKNVLENGTKKPNRTGIDTISVTGTQLRHDMRTGFPLVTVKKTPFKTICVELEGFIKGIQDKKWYQDRGCHIWDSWCNPLKVPYNNNEDTKLKMAEERDLGRIYGVQGRDWINYKDMRTPIDQLKNIVNTLKTNPLDRRMIVTYWNPSDLDCQSLPPCHYLWQVLSDGKYIDLIFNMRSVDVGLGMPFDIAHYGMMLTLLSLETKLIPRWLVGNFADTHIYENHIDGMKEVLNREPYQLPTVEVPGFTSIFEWTYEQRKLNGYRSHDKISMEVAI